MSRYIDADLVRRVIESPRSKEQMINILKGLPTADVVERKDTILDKTEAHYWFEYIDDHKNIVFKLPYALTDITDIRIRLDKYGLRDNVKGKWIPIEKGEKGYSAGDFRCSVCGQPNKCYSLTPYCCNCGARMGGE